jgi:hypothetical protein
MGHETARGKRDIADESAWSAGQTPGGRTAGAVGLIGAGKFGSMFLAQVPSIATP